MPTLGDTFAITFSDLLVVGYELVGLSSEGWMDGWMDETFFCWVPATCLTMVVHSVAFLNSLHTNNNPQAGCYFTSRY
jgi:hypothetical protein